MTRLFARIGCISFGGPAGQIALMHDKIVVQRQWVDEPAYLRALNLCHILPGPEAQQLATWIGWRLHGVPGGLVAGLLFVLPGAAVMLALSVLYALAANVTPVAALFLGIKAAVLAIVVHALLRIARRTLDSAVKRTAALIAFAALFLFNIPFPVLVAAAFGAGFAMARTRPDWLNLPPAASALAPPHPIRPWRYSLGTVALWLAIWAAPLIAVFLTLGPSHVLWKIGLFFSKLAVVTFGGAYAVLAYMAQHAVQTMHWLDARTMADGLGLAETTPGPLIMVTQFVGFFGAFHDPAPFTPMLAGMLGAALTTWVTFAPCFLWIFLFAPWMARLEHATGLQGAMALVTAAVVGVIANLALWFMLHVLFSKVAVLHAGPISLQWPAWTTIDWRVLGIATLSAVLLFKARWAMLRVLAVAGASGMILAMAVP